MVAGIGGDISQIHLMLDLVSITNFRCYNIEDYEIKIPSENWYILLFLTATKDGLQMSGIAGMIERIAGVKMSWDLRAIMMSVFYNIKLSNIYQYLISS